MATRQEICKWCRARLLVPVNAATTSCTRCGGPIQLLPNRNGSFSISVNANANRVPSNNSAVTGSSPPTNGSKPGKEKKLPRVQTSLGSQASPPPPNGPNYNGYSLPTANGNASGVSRTNSAITASPTNANKQSKEKKLPQVQSSLGPQVSPTPLNGPNRDGYSLPTVNGNNGGVPRNNSAITASPTNAYKQGMEKKLPRVQTFLGPQVSPPPLSGPKRAVLCGVSYKGHPKSLKGSINDVMSMKYLLLEKLGFPDASIIVLTEDEKDPSRIPTKMNIRKALHWLVQGCKEGDSLVFHYSGHGSRIRDRNGDEIDGHDEAICPVDFETEGRILDDEINDTIVGPLTTGVTLHAIIDTCFSGTCLDLPFMCRMNREGYYKWEDHRTPAAYKGTKGGLAISISACDDHQTSGDTTAFTGSSTGALTYSFIQTIENEPKLTYGQLLISMRNKVNGAQRAVSQNGSFASSQEPQLSASKTFDIHSKKVTLKR